MGYYWVFHAVHSEEVNKSDHGGKAIRRGLIDLYWWGCSNLKEKKTLDFYLIIYVNKNKQRELNIDEWLTLE